MMKFSDLYLRIMLLNEFVPKIVYCLITVPTENLPEASSHF